MRYKALILLFFVFSNNFYCQIDSVVFPKPLTELTLEELLNTDIISSTKILQKTKEAPSIITSINLQNLQTFGAITLIDALKLSPGIEVSMGNDGFYRVALRGSRKEGNILLLIDGQSANDFYSGRAIFDMPIDFIERVEIIRGPGSSIYGTNAMVGIINIITIKNNSIAVGAGINNTIKLGANFFKQKENLSISTSIGGQTSKGANAQIDTDKVNNYAWSLTALNKSFKTNRWNNDGYLNTDITYKDLHIKLFNFARQQGTWAGPLFIATSNSKLFTNQFVGSITYDYKISDNVIISPKFYSNINYHDFLIQETPENYVSTVSGNLFKNGKQSKEGYLGKTYGVSTDILIKANDHLEILTGTVFEDLHLSNYNLTRNYKIIGEENKYEFGNYDNVSFDQKNKRRAVFAYFIQAAYKYKDLNITTGVRYDDYSDFGQSFNPRIGVTYKVNKIYNIKGLYGKAFRAPTFSELYDNTTIGNAYGVKGNVLLKPELVSTIDIENGFDFKRISLKYNLYYINNSNLIRIYDPHGGGSIGKYTNVGDVESFGHELDAVLKISKKIQLFANYSQFISQFRWDNTNTLKSDLKFYEKQPSYLKTLTNTPTIRANIGLTIYLKKMELFISGNYGNDSYNNNRFYLEQDHYAHIPYYIQANGNIKYNFTKNFIANITFSNIGKKFSDPDESTSIDAYGKRGMAQPTASALLNLIYLIK